MPYRRRFQPTVSCCGQKTLAVSVMRKATFIAMEPSGTEGHNIIYEAIPQWLPYARDYLKSLGFNTDAE